MTIQFEIKGCLCFLSDEDADLLHYAWYPVVGKTRQTAYLISQNYSTHDKKSTLLHRVVLQRMLGRELVKDDITDHIDGNGLNNVRDNLRLATRSQNLGNSRLSIRNKFGLKGVSAFRDGFMAGITVNKQRIYLGVYETPELAHAAYVVAAKEHFGEFANDGSASIPDVRTVYQKPEPRGRKLRPDTALLEMRPRATPAPLPLTPFQRYLLTDWHATHACMQRMAEQGAWDIADGFLQTLRGLEQELGFKPTTRA